MEDDDDDNDFDDNDFDDDSVQNLEDYDHTNDFYLTENEINQIKNKFKNKIIIYPIWDPMEIYGKLCHRKDKTKGLYLPFIKCKTLLYDIDYELTNILRLNMNSKELLFYKMICCPIKRFKPILRYLQYEKMVMKSEEVYCDIHNCGKRITDGVKAELFEFPHMCGIGKMDNENFVLSCGGNLISEKFILTAAHCCLGSSTTVRFGHITNQDNKTCCSNHCGNHEIDRIFRFTDLSCSCCMRTYNIKNKIKYKYNIISHDIGLIELNENVIFNYWVYPACLPQTRDIPKFKWFAMGWGKLSHFDFNNGSLKKVVLQEVDSVLCKSIKYRKILPFNDTYNICAGSLNKGDTCQGDSGGPLLIKASEYGSMFYRLNVIIAVTSTSYTCGGKGTYGIYVRVENFLDWIESIVWPN